MKSKNYKASYYEIFFELLQLRLVLIQILSTAQGALLGNLQCVFHLGWETKFHTFTKEQIKLWFVMLFILQCLYFKIGNKIFWTNLHHFCGSVGHLLWDEPSAEWAWHNKGLCSCVLWMVISTSSSPQGQCSKAGLWGPKLVCQEDDLSLP